jgi:stearoyl-CoA desaturase (delta-9 desaturase)
MPVVRSIPFWSVHLAAVVGVAAVGWSWSGLALAIALYYARMFFLSAGFHRYFAHRTFKTSRAFQFALALGGTLATQKGPLWWAANHRTHHKYSDQPGDIHSPRQRGFWWSHAGWFLSGEHAHTEWRRITDLARYPELRWLDRHYALPPVALALLLFATGGLWALVWAFFVSTVLLWHGTFVVNSLAHLVGRRRYQTNDDSRNNLGIALITMGEGWHNNHHHYPAAANQGFFWWEIDVSYYLLRLLSWLGLIWDLRAAPAHVVRRASWSATGDATPRSEPPAHPA